ncbi:MAG: hypothetical protein M3010_08900, partial [Candidatus Dormibacteraeota bacterium]|nr:hypothetical protein [Candidatus Dormibacteraeota bacterium]
AGPMVCSDTFDHTSLLKFLERVFGAEIPSRDPNAPGGPRAGISAWRRDNKNVGDLTSAFNFAAAPNVGAVTLAGTSHTDLRSTTECPASSLTLGTGTFTDAYPIATPEPMPRQETAPGPVHRPSGVCAATTPSGPSMSPGPGGGVTRLTLPDTSVAHGPEVAAAAVVAGGVALAGWWSRRLGESGETPPD